MFGKRTTVYLLLTQEKNNINLQICPNLNKETDQVWIIAFHVSTFFSIVVFLLYIKCMFFDVSRFSVLLDLYCLVKCSYNHSLM